MEKLSILIPSRDEEFLHKTIEDILAHAEGDIEILVGLDGWTQDTHIYDHPKIEWLYKEQPIGQRAMTNKLAKIATGKYIMKVDGHCSFAQGFDKEMLKTMTDNVIVAPLLMNLHVYDWNCPEHMRTYQGKQCCEKAEKLIVWQPKPKPAISNYVFDTNFVMQYAPEQPKDALVETMCLQGSAWMVARETYWKWKLGEESLGSWGCQGTELGIKAYLNGGKCLTNTNTYYAHLFRGHDDFPYDRGENPGKQAHDELIKRYKNDEIKGLVEKFDYPCDWTEYFMV